MRGSDTDDTRLWEMHYTVNTMCARVQTATTLSVYWDWEFNNGGSDVM